MADKVSSKVRSTMMSAVKGKNTSPERSVRSQLFRRGFRFRLHARELPGSPDLILPRYRVAVFVHGCFWHGHDCPRGRRPQTNKEFWNHKIDGNIKRDRVATTKLKQAGWSVTTIWACRLDVGIKRLVASLERRRELSRG